MKDIFVRNKFLSHINVKNIIVGALIWIASPILILSSQNALSTNPVPFLMPVFFWLLINSLNNSAKFNRWHFGLWMLIGLFWHLEMAFTFGLPVIILIIFQLNNKKYWISKAFLYGAVIFIIWLLPQLIFDMRHQWIMSQSILRYLTEQSSGQLTYNPMFPFGQIINTYYSQLSALLMNSSVLVWTSVVTIAGALLVVIKRQKLFEDKLFLSSLILFIGSIVIYTFVPIAVMPWHILGQMTGWLLLLLTSLRIIRQNFKQGNVVYWVITAIVVFNSAISLQSWLGNKNSFKNDTASFHNQTAAIDEVYNQAKGENFKAYVYMPSVIDYPYQYLFWWYGLKKYGYTPTDYAYLPNQPVYIADKSLFNHLEKNTDTGLIFLIKEPDHNFTRPGWEGTFINYPVVSKKTVGPLEIEVRRGN